MPDGTGVGSIFLDLIVRDTVDKQIQSMASKAQTTAQQAFSGLDKAAEKAANNATASIGGSFNKSVELAKTRVKELETQLGRITAKLNEAKAADNDTATQKLLAQQEAIYDRVTAARERLAIQAQAAAEKQAAAEASAAQKTAAAADVAAAKQQAAVSQAHTAADPPPTGGTGDISWWQRLTAAASGFRGVASRAFSIVSSGAKSLASRLLGVQKRFTGAGRSAQSFSTRFKSIVSSALVFNGLSAVLRNVTTYLGNALKSTDQMRDALANLKGAAANAAAPILDVLTPALTALANAAATVFSYISRLMSLLTGKAVSAASTAAKSAKSAAGAAKKATASLAGFDEIQKLDGNNGDSGGGDSGNIEPNYDFQGKSPFLDQVLAAVEAGQWTQVGGLIAQKLNDSLAKIAWPDIQSKAKTWTQNLVGVLNGFIQNLDWGLLGGSLGNGLNTALLVIDTFFQGVDWTSLGAGLGAGLNNLIATADWAMLGRVLTDRFKALFEMLHGFVQTFDFTALGGSLATMLNAAFGNIDWAQLMADISAGIVGLLAGAAALVYGLNWGDLGASVYDCIMAIDWGGMIAGLLELLAGLATGLLVSLGSLLHNAFQDLGVTISSYFTDVGKNGIQGFLDGMMSLLCDIGSWLYEHLVEPVISGVKNALGIHSPSTVFAEIGQYLILGLLNGITSIWQKVPDFFVKAFKSMQQSIVQIWTNGIVPAIKGAINGIIGAINGMISGIANGINTVIRALNSLSFTIPDWVPGFGGRSFGFNISTVAAPQIPYLASGGVITQPTLAMVGEYAGARNNPEIVAPQSILEEIMASVMQDLVNSNLQGFEAVVSMLREILEAILDIEIGDEVIAKAVERYNRKMAVVRGGT